MLNFNGKKREPEKRDKNENSSNVPFAKLGRYGDVHFTNLTAS